jgi:hypothetical protein
MNGKLRDGWSRDIGRSTSTTALLTIVDTGTFDLRPTDLALVLEDEIVLVADLSSSSNGGVVIGTIGEWG